MTSVRVALPHHLRTLAGVGAEVVVDVPGDPTIAHVLDALEAAHPALRGTIRDPVTGQRRPFMRFVACGEDLSHAPGDVPLPTPIGLGADVLRVVGAIAGGS